MVTTMVVVVVGGGEGGGGRGGRGGHQDFFFPFPPKSFSPAVRFINLVPALHNATTLCKEHKH